MSLEARLNLLEERIKKLEVALLPPTDALQKGKYAGKSASEIASKHPDYVAWCNEKGLAQGIGFSEADIEAAYDKLKEGGVLGES